MPLDVTIVVESNDTDSYDSDVTIIVKEFMRINRVSFMQFMITKFRRIYILLEYWM